MPAYYAARNRGLLRAAKISPELRDDQRVGQLFGNANTVSVPPSAV